MIFNADGTFHAIKPDGSRDYDAELKYATLLSRMAAHAKANLDKTKLSSRQILADPRGISAIARAVVACDMDISEAECRAFTIACAASVEPDAAIDTLHRQIARYETEKPRVSRAIRASVRPMMEQRKPPNAIKQKAAEVNKLGILTPEEVTEVLRSEYMAWKTTA